MVYCSLMRLWGKDGKSGRYLQSVLFLHHTPSPSPHPSKVQWTAQLQTGLWTGNHWWYLHPSVAALAFGFPSWEPGTGGGGVAGKEAAVADDDDDVYGVVGDSGDDYGVDTDYDDGDDADDTSGGGKQPGSSGSPSAPSVRA